MYNTNNNFRIQVFMNNLRKSTHDEALLKKNLASHLKGNIHQISKTVLLLTYLRETETEIGTSAREEREKQGPCTAGSPTYS